MPSGEPAATQAAGEFRGSTRPGADRRSAMMKFLILDDVTTNCAILGRLARHNNPLVAGAAEEAVPGVEPQLGLAMLLIRPVALHAVMRQNRPHMHPKPHLPRRSRPGLAKRQPPGQHRKNPNNFP